jgi:hypothetical protein
MKNLELSAKKAEEAAKKTEEAHKKRDEDNKKQMDLMMNMLAAIGGKTPVGITKQKSHSKSRARLSTVVERREILASRTPFGGIPVNQTGGGGLRTDNKLGFVTPRDLDDNTNNSLLYPKGDMNKTPGEKFDPYKHGFGFEYDIPKAPEPAPGKPKQVSKVQPAPTGDPDGDSSSSDRKTVETKETGKSMRVMTRRRKNWMTLDRQ